MSSYDDPHWYEQPDQPEQPDTNPSLPKQPTYNGKWPANGSSPDNDVFIQPLPPQQPRPSVPIYDDNDDRSRRLFRQTAISIVLVLLAFLGGWFSHQALLSPFSPGNQSQSYEKLFEQAWNLIDQNYVDRKAVNYKNMSYDAIKAMLAVLGDTGHTRFLTPQDVQAESQSLSGKFVGIGITLDIDKTTKFFVITSTIPGAPAEHAGLKRGDLITAVNGTSTQGKDINAVRALIRGNEGTSVALTIQRPSTQKTFIVNITRAQITVPNVLMYYIAQDHIADIQIVQFATGISAQVKADLQQAKKDGATKFILDLRDDPGGYLQEAVNTASLFLPSGDNVLLEQDSSGQRTPVAVSGNPIDTTSPIVVLINGGTASAAEIVSGALQENNRATLIGENTFGTGTVLNEYALNDGSALLIGTQEWLTPKGHFIRDLPHIQPNITVTLNQGANPLTPADESSSNLTEQQILSSGDAQLVKAIQYLDAHSSPSSGASQGGTAGQAFTDSGQLAYESPLWDSSYTLSGVLGRAA